MILLFMLWQKFYPTTPAIGTLSEAQISDIKKRDQAKEKTFLKAIDSLARDGITKELKHTAFEKSIAIREKKSMATIARLERRIKDYEEAKKFVSPGIDTAISTVVARADSVVEDARLQSQQFKEEKLSWETMDWVNQTIIANKQASIDQMSAFMVHKNAFSDSIFTALQAEKKNTKTMQRKETVSTIEKWSLRALVIVLALKILTTK